MASSVAEQAAGYPLAAYHFRVAVDGVAMGFAEVSGLQREYQTLTYRHGLSAFEGEAIVKFRVDKFAPLTLKKGVIASADHRALFAWLEATTPRSMLVSLCDHDGQPVVNWRIARALLTKIEAPAFNAAGNEAAIQTLQVMAAGVTVEQV